MCNLGKLTKKELTNESVEGYRGWFIKYIKEDNELKQLYPLNQHTHIPFSLEKESMAIIESEDSFINKESGFYAYNNNYYNYNK